MAIETKSYIVGNKPVPDWVNEQSSDGRIRFNYEDGDLINVVVFSPVKTFKANVGDVILFTKSGLSVIPKEKAEKYNVR